MDKIFKLFHTRVDSGVITTYIFKIFNEEIVSETLDLFEMLSTIKPLFDVVHKGQYEKGSSSLFAQFTNMFSFLIYEGRNQQYTNIVKIFEK